MSDLIFRIVVVLALSLIVCPVARGEDVIWRNPPLGGTVAVPNRVINMIGPGSDESRDYLLPKILVDAGHGNTGVVDIMTTYFLDDAPTVFGTITGQAVLNVFVVESATLLPSPNETPDDGFIVDVTITQNLTEGWIEVRADNLAAIGPRIEIFPGERYFIGLTPIFLLGNEPFGGLALANTVGKSIESQSAFRSTAPVFEDWFFAGDLFGPPDLFGTTVIEPLRLGDANCDGKIDLLDVAPFVDFLVTGQYSTKADINQDGIVDPLDVFPFVNILAGQ